MRRRRRWRRRNGFGDLIAHLAANILCGAFLLLSVFTVFVATLIFILFVTALLPIAVWTRLRRAASRLGLVRFGRNYEFTLNRSLFSKPLSIQYNSLTKQE